MADSFGTISFTVLQAGLGRAQQADVTERHIPGGTVTYFDYGGQRARSFSYGLLLDQTNYYALEGTVGGTAALKTDVDGTISTAVLMGLTRDKRIPVSGTTFAAASFTVVTT
jgi:hypothetical protein